MLRTTVWQKPDQKLMIHVSVLQSSNRCFSTARKVDQSPRDNQMNSQEVASGEENKKKVEKDMWNLIIANQVTKEMSL